MNLSFPHSAPSSAPKGPKSNQPQTQNQKNNSRPGPVRSVSGNGTRGGKSGRGGKGNNRAPNKTAGDLDSELEAFMKAPPGSVAGANGTEKSDHAPMVSLFTRKVWLIGARREVR